MPKRISKEELEKRKELYCKKDNPKSNNFVSGSWGVVIGTSKYKYVTHTTDGFRAKLLRLKVCKTYKTEREAALRIDMALIENGEQPVNILKKK